MTVTSAERSFVPSNARGLRNEIRLITDAFRSQGESVGFSRYLSLAYEIARNGM